MPPFDITLIARLASGMYGLQLGNATMNQLLAAVNSTSYGSVAALANALAARETRTDAQLAADLLDNVGLTAAQVTALSPIVATILGSAPAGQKGAAVLNLLNTISTVTHPDYVAAVTAFNRQISQAVIYAQTAGTRDVAFDSQVPAFGITASTIAGANNTVLDVMRLLGNTDVRVDFTNTANQIRGLDIDGDGLIEADGVENKSITVMINGVAGKTAAGFEITDAYARNAWNQNDTVNNFLGDIFYDGTGYGGDGVNTDGNIVLGGLGSDRLFGGIGNDFLAGGSVAQARPGLNLSATFDFLSGGRNADFAFAELSALDRVDGTNLRYDGGETADNSNGTQTKLTDPLGSSNDRDWLLLEASDDDEAVSVVLTDDAPATVPGAGGAPIPSNPADNVPNQRLTTRDGQVSNASLWGVEAVDASGNLYGFLNNVNVMIGGRAMDERSTASKAGTENFGFGSTAQIIVTGSDSANIVVGGYDNDTVDGAGGNDILFGGNLGYLQTNKNNPNLIDAKGGLSLNVNAVSSVTDGRDVLNGDNDNDSIVWEAGNNTVDGGNHFDVVYGTNFSAGRLAGALGTDDQTAAQAAAMAKLSPDSIVRMDLAVGAGPLVAGGGDYRDYGGANRGLGFGPVEARTADQTRYDAALGARPASTVVNVEGVITTGLGDIDYRAAGTNSPDLNFNNQQNYLGSTARYDVRGIDTDAVSTTKFGAYWTDTNFGLDTVTGKGLSNLLATGVGSGAVAFRDGGDNLVYLSAGNDNLEGRQGDDELGGGRGDDNFFFDFGDSTDIIRRQTDKDGDNIWDTDAAGNRLYQQDFRADPTGVAATILQVSFDGSTVIDGVNTVIGSILLTINPGTAGAIKLNSGDLSTNKSLTDVATAATKAFAAQDAAISVQAVGTSLVITDTKGRDISDTAAEGYFVFGSVSNSNLQSKAVLNPGGQTLQENDRVIFVDYASRLGNTLVNDLEDDLGNQAQLLVVGTGGTTTLANGQEWRIQFQNVNPGDTVTVDINGTKLTRTALDGEDTDLFTKNFAAQINGMLDVNTSAGKLLAAAAVNVVGAANEEVLTINQAVVGNGVSNNKVFMAQPVVTITSAGGGVSGATAQLANTSATSIELLGYASGNGNINPDNVLFLGRSGQASLSSANNASVIHTAKDAGGTITGKDALVVLQPTNRPASGVFSATSLFQAINGDDQFIGGPGNDVFNGLTGSDRFLGSWGTDTISGGGSTAASLTTNNVSFGFTDSLLFQENDFGVGTTFTVAPSANLDDKGKGTVTSVLGTKNAVTTFDGIEELRTVSNTAQDVLDFSGLSNSVAAATGASSNRDGVTGPLDAAQKTPEDRNEGVLVRLTAATAGIFWAADRNNDDTTTQAGEIGANPLGIFGIENVIGGNANDTVVMDQTQAGSTNSIKLGGELPDLTPVDTFVEGADNVTYNHADVNGDGLIDPVGGPLDAPLRPVMTVLIESAAGVDKVSSTNGALGKATVTDTLENVEELGFTAAATSSLVQKDLTAADTLNVSSIAGGAVVNFSTVGNVVGKALGGQVTPANTVAIVEVNTLEAGGVAAAGANYGNELAEIIGIAQFERVIGSAGNDRVIVGNSAMEALNANNAAVGSALFDPAIAKYGYNFFGNYTIATRTFANATTGITNLGLYTFDLGAGTSDVLDYRTGAFGVAVSVDFTTTAGVIPVDAINVDGDANGLFTNRVDRAIDVERFFGTSNTVPATGALVVANANNIIDLSRATEASTVTFGFESSVSGNEFKDPNGWTNAAATPVTQVDSVTGIRVGTTGTNNPTAAMFMQATALNGIANSALWNQIEGTNFAETVVFSQFQDRNANETLNLRGGANTVDYTNAVLAGKADSYVLVVPDFTPTKGVTTAHAGYTVTHSSADDAVADVDKISIDRQYDNAFGVVDGSLLIIGSSNSLDRVNIGDALVGFKGPTAAAFATGVKFGTSTAITPEATKWTDIMGAVGGGHNKVDLGSGAGTTSGSVVQDVSLNVKDASTDAAGKVALQNDNVLTSIKAFEDITGSAFNDRLFGNDNNNKIDGGVGNDLIQGRGGSDTITSGTGFDRIVFVGPDDSAHINNPTASAVAPTNITAASGFDSLVDFDNDFGAGQQDLFVIDRAAGWANLIGTKAVATAAGVANTFSSNNGTGIVLFTDANALDSTTMLNMNNVVTKLGAAITVDGTAAAGRRAIFAMDATTVTAVYVWEDADEGNTAVDTNGDGNAFNDFDGKIQANELRLLTTTDDTDVGGADSDVMFALSDLAVRFGAQAGRQLNQVLIPGVREEVVYNNVNQSAYGAIDSFGALNAGGTLAATVATVTAAFRGGEDKIDLSGFNLGAQGVLAINRAIIVDQTGPANSITDANAKDFFIETSTGIRRAIRIEVDADDLDVALVTGVQGRARLFVDLDANAQLDTTTDLFIDFSFVVEPGDVAALQALMTGAVPTLATGSANPAQFPGVPGYGDIIFGV